MARTWARWSEEELATLARMWPTHTAPEIRAVIPHRSLGSIYEAVHRLGLQKDPEWQAMRRKRETENLRKHGKQYRFRKGQKPHNKGRKGITGSHPNTQKSWFKKGFDNGKSLPVGTERVNTDGYLMRKVDNKPHAGRDGNWRFVHRELWIEHHGPIPKSHAVVFRNGDKLDVRLENLELVSRIELMARNSFTNYPEEVQAAIRAQSRLTRVLNTERRRYGR